MFPHRILTLTRRVSEGVPAAATRRWLLNRLADASDWYQANVCHNAASRPMPTGDRGVMRHAANRMGSSLRDAA